MVARTNRVRLNSLLVLDCAQFRFWVSVHLIRKSTTRAGARRARAVASGVGVSAPAIVLDKQDGGLVVVFLVVLHRQQDFENRQKNQVLDEFVHDLLQKVQKYVANTRNTLL